MPPLHFSDRSKTIETNGISMKVHEDGPEDGVPIGIFVGEPMLGEFPSCLRKSS